MTDLLYRSAGELLTELAERRVSARELLDAHVARHTEQHERLNAVIATDLERARAAAGRIDDARARNEPVGALAGLPMTVKDSYDVTGMPAVSGAAALTERPKDCPDADVVATARRAGAVIWGKTNVPTMLADVQTFNPVFGTTNNPYDPSRTPAGSSGGSAAALAAGITPLEIGSDIGGSLRHPANFCGVYALKPTFGTLSLRGSVPPGPGVFLPSDLSVAGPMARSADDLRLLFDVLRGWVPTGPVAPSGSGRVALWLDEPEFEVSEEVRAAVLLAADALRGQGVTVEEAAPPMPAGQILDTYLRLLYPIITARMPDEVFTRLQAGRADALAALAEGASPYGPETVAGYATATFREVERARLVREELKESLAAWFADWDAILCPVSPVPAFPHDHSGGFGDRTLELDGRAVPYGRMFDWISLASLTHAPALAAPVSRTAAGLPVGVQLIGPWGADDRLFGLAAALERATGGFHPPIA